MSLSDAVTDLRMARERIAEERQVQEARDQGVAVELSDMLFTLDALIERAIRDLSRVSDGPPPQADLGGIDGSGWSPGDPWALHDPSVGEGIGCDGVG